MSAHTSRVVLLAALMASTAACRQTPTETLAAGPPTLSVTHWSDKTEVFMEYPPLVAGQTARFAVHLTTLGDFKAVTAGRPRLELTPEAGGAPDVLQGMEPSRPGVFRVEGAPKTPGRYRWALVVDAPGLSDRHDLGTVTVFSDTAMATAEAEKPSSEDPTSVAYLKEQQWANEFATEVVREVDVRSAIRVPATIEALSGGEAVIVAPAAGRFTAEALVSIGETVRAGQVVGRLEPRLTGVSDRATLAADVAEAQIAVEAAHAEQVRAERLLAERAIPARRVEDAGRAVALASAKLRGAEARLAQRDEALSSGGGLAAGNAFALRSPIAGRVADVLATLGASYNEGAPLFKIVRTDGVELRTQVPPSDVQAARSTGDIAFETAGRPDPLPLRFSHMHDAGVIDVTTRALPLQFDVSNPDGTLLIGQSGTAILYRREVRKVTGVRRDGVLREAGRPYVFVHVSGERFVRRAVELSEREGEWIGVTRGLAPGERVVTRGAYEIQLASAARGLSAEGHVH